ncbi:uncharacterized protein LOC118457328 [Anopheles albimanus]|uniref:uncharacterized protein LOC118457328 n=1 Tax=Anopheles albimanus TaxID=7167 RepID=UPI00164009BC|nr:uncharacterized protein LOC118457328 [Anopheles albimanus]
MSLKARAWLFAILIASSSAESESCRSDEVVQYVGNMMLHQKIHYFGTFVCWLLQIGEDPEPELVSRSLAQKLSNSHEVVVIQAAMRTSYSSAYPTPNMVIMFADQLNDYVNTSVSFSWLSGIPPKCLVVLVFRLTNETIAESVANVWSSYNLLNVVMISLNEDVMFSFMYMPLRMIRHTGYPRFDYLFYDRIATLAEVEVKGIYVMDAFTMQLGDIVGEDSRLFQLFFERLGIRFSCHMLNCQVSEHLMDCIRRQKGSFIVLNRLTLSDYRKDAVDAIEMDKYVILAPRGRLLSFTEIWIKPFDWSVWIVLAIICFTSYLMHRIAPKTIGNNLFLLALIGLEKRKLRLSGRLEKFMAAGLLVLFYQMKCAYETKIIAYMIDTPSEADPTTIEDLRRRNIKIFLDDKSINRTIMQSNYDIIIDERDYNKLYSLKSIAFFANKGQAEILNVVSLTVDPETGKQRYVFLKENFFTGMLFFTFSTTHLFMERFARFQRTIFEAGLKLQWRSIVTKFFRKNRMLMLQTLLRERQENIVEAEKLWLIFMLAATMWSIAGIVFLIEIGLARGRKRWISIRKT